MENGDRESVLTALHSGAWVEYFTEIPEAGTYHVTVSISRGADRGIYRLVADGYEVGQTFDLYASKTGNGDIPIGDVTFLEGGKHVFRLVAVGKNSASSNYSLTLMKISLRPMIGFTLASPNGACLSDGTALLRWNSWPGTTRYVVQIDAKRVVDVIGSETSCRVSGLAKGRHFWHVTAESNDGKKTMSNFLSFTTGSPGPYPDREFADDFSSGLDDNWELDSRKRIKKTEPPAKGILFQGHCGAYLKGVSMEQEGEISAVFTPSTENSSGGVGFQSDDGTRLYVVADSGRQELRIERRVRGYSIFDVTPRAYQIPGWRERAEGDAMVWEIATKKVPLRVGIGYRLKLAFSRRSGCVMASLADDNGSNRVSLRDLSDVRTPDHPLLVSLSGTLKFEDMAYRRLNRQTYKWDPDSVRIVLRPGPPGSWDGRGAFNPAVLVHDGTWYMIYRGNALPAPPNGPPASELGLATSSDGIHWVKCPRNPILLRANSKDTKEDPDLIWAAGENHPFLEYRTYSPVNGEVMCSSSNWVDWGPPWILNTGKSFGKIAGFIDTVNSGLAGIAFDGSVYRYVAAIEEGRIDLSHDLHKWTTAGIVPLNGHRASWCNDHECIGDIFVDSDGNIRFESQAGVRPGNIVGNRLCTIMEGVLNGSDPTKVLWRGDLPWLPDWYGDAPTGSPEDFTASNGSVFPGQTIIKDGWLWHYCGGNNTFVLLCKCRYGPVFECRDLQAGSTTNGSCPLSLIVRNVGSLSGKEKLTARVDGFDVGKKELYLERDQETTVDWSVPVPVGVHTVSIEDLSVTIRQKLKTGNEQ